MSHRSDLHAHTALPGACHDRDHILAPPSIQLLPQFGVQIEEPPGVSNPPRGGCRSWTIEMTQPGGACIGSCDSVWRRVFSQPVRLRLVLRTMLSAKIHRATVTCLLY